MDIANLDAAYPMRDQAVEPTHHRHHQHDGHAVLGTSPPMWITMAEVAEELRVSTRTVMRWAQDDRLPVLVLPGGRKRIHRLALDHWLESRTSQPGQGA